MNLGFNRTILSSFINLDFEVRWELWLKLRYRRANSYRQTDSRNSRRDWYGSLICKFRGQIKESCTSGSYTSRAHMRINIYYSKRQLYSKHSNSYLSVTPSVCLSIHLPQTLRRYMLTIADFTVRSTGVDSSIAIRRLPLMTATCRLNADSHDCAAARSRRCAS